MFWSCGVGKFVLTPPVLKPITYETMCELCDCLSFLSGGCIVTASLEPFRQKLVECLWKFEQVFPATEHAIVFHLLVHVYDSIKAFGPVHAYWMYPFERFLGSLTRKMHDRAHPETNLLNVHTTDLALDNIVRQHRAELFKGIPSKFHVASPFVPNQPAINGNVCVCIYNANGSSHHPTTAMLEEIRDGLHSLGLTTTSAELAAALASGRVDVRTQGVKVMSHEDKEYETAARHEARWTSEGARRARSTTNKYSYFSGSDGTRRKYVGHVRFFCFISLDVDSGPIELAAVRVHEVRHDKGPVPYFTDGVGDSEDQVVSCRRFGGVVGTGRKEEVPDALFVFARSDTMGISYK